jgi:hypothetical protein
MLLKRRVMVVGPALNRLKVGTRSPRDKRDDGGRDE